MAPLGADSRGFPALGRRDKTAPGASRKERVMGSRVKPEPEQQCECSSHAPSQPADKNLRRVYFERKKFCYEWWCKDCYGKSEVGEAEDGWPTGDDGRFVKPVHCPTIPGLD